VVSFRKKCRSLRRTLCSCVRVARE